MRQKSARERMDPIIAELTAQVPVSVTMAQARVVLEAAGLTSAVNTAISALGPEAAIAWEYATEVHRTNTALLAAATQLGLTKQQVDALFVQAARVRL